MSNINLKTFANGALQEQFAKSLERVLANLADPNTPYKNVRNITITMKFTQNEKRDDVVVAVTVSEKLAAQSPIGTNFAVAKDLRTGKIHAEEYGRNLAGQYSMEDFNVDPETGEAELKNTAATGVIEFPSAAQA